MADELKPNHESRMERTGTPPSSARGPYQSKAAHPEVRPLGWNRRNWPGDRAMLAMGRAILGGYFLYNGVNHFLNRTMLAGYARSKNVAAADIAVPASGAMIALGGLSVLMGMRPKLGASLIAAFLLGVSPKMHNFWDIEDEQQRMHEFVNFTKNMALVGAAFLLAAFPEPWPVAVPQRTGHALLVA